MANNNIYDKQDIWSRWILHRRHADNPELLQTVIEFLIPVRDRVLANIELKAGEVLLDVGCGDGLIGFGALQKFPESQVIFSDISINLLEHTRSLAQEAGLAGRCQFIQASADDLRPLPDESVEAVTTRSVLIYVPDKLQAFAEFYRVLKPSGCMSIFEPINRFSYPDPPQLFGGYDVTPVMEIADKVKDVFDSLQPPDTDPMIDFDERDLLDLVEKAGFKEIHLELQIKIGPPRQGSSWESFAQTPGNPKIPTLEEAMRQVLTMEEIIRFTDHLRPLVESRQGTERSAVAYLWAVKI